MLLHFRCENVDYPRSWYKYTKIDSYKIHPLMECTWNVPVECTHQTNSQYLYFSCVTTI